MSSDDPPVLFQFFNEIGIIHQLSRAAFEARLPDGFLVPHFSVLNHLVRVGEGTTPLRLAKAFQVPKTSMTHTLSGLEWGGLIEMRPNPKDGRSKCVYLTDAGRRFREDAIVALGPDMADLAGSIDPDRIAAILPLLREVREFMDQARDGTED